MTVQCKKCKRTVGIQTSEESTEFRLIDGHLRAVPGCGHANVVDSLMQCTCGAIVTR